MKVSKPVIIFGVVILLLAGYIHFFTGKKKPVKPVSVAPVASNQTQQQNQQPAAVNAPPAVSAQTNPAVSPIKAGQAEAAPPVAKPDFGKIRVAWMRNPFILPQFKEEKKKESLSAVRLLGIFEKGKDRVAIIDHEIVRKGDMVGDEKVMEIEKDKVILGRNNARRTLSLTAIEDTMSEEEPKKKDTEKGK